MFCRFLPEQSAAVATMPNMYGASRRFRPFSGQGRRLPDVPEPTGKTSLLDCKDTLLNLAHGADLTLYTIDKDSVAGIWQSAVGKLVDDANVNASTIDGYINALGNVNDNDAKNVENALQVTNRMKRVWEDLQSSIPVQAKRQCIIEVDA